MDDRPTNAADFSAQWRDALGQDWQVTANPQVIVLRNEQQTVHLLRQDWTGRIEHDTIDQRVVLRIDAEQRQIGFLLREQEFRSFSDAVQWSNDRAVASTARLITSNERARTWPTVSVWSVVGLFAAGLAVLPYIGMAFAIVAVLSVWATARAWRRSNRLVHSGSLMIATTIVLAVALLAQMIALYSRNAKISAAGSVLSASDEISLASKITAVIIVLLSLSIHEAAHALSAWWCGDLGPLQQNRVTLNPLSHIDPIVTVLVPAFMAFTGSTIFGWARPVSVSLHGVPNPRRANILISAAGPFSNLLLALLFFSLYMILGCVLQLWVPHAQVINYAHPHADVIMLGFPGADYVALTAVMFKWGFMINTILFVFNLLPVPPLDGSHIFVSLVPTTIGALYNKLSPFSLIVFLMLIASGVLQYLLLPATVICALGFFWVGVCTI